MEINGNREVISLEQTLAYLKYLNQQKPFDRQVVQIPTKNREQLFQPTKTKPLNNKQIKSNILEAEDQDYKKKINKNRAIKRIIESSKQILQGFNNYEPEDTVNNSEKSATVQFNIYLKQYNRVLELIFNKEKDQLIKEARKGEEREDILQNIYEFTVVEDFREILPVATLKEKILKANIEIMINALTDCLVVLKSNQLKIYESANMNSAAKTFKLHEIQNVDYHNQPYIFIVLTVQKDKQRSNIYMKFESAKNQDKWDRALYCCYMSRKMKKKDKLFSIEYPEDDVKKKEKEEIKKVAAFSYQPEKQKVIEKAYYEKKGINKSDRSIKDEGSENQEMIPGGSKKSQTEKSARNLSNKSVSNHDRVNPSQNLQKQEEIRPPKGTESHREIETQKIQGLNRHQTDNLPLNRSQTPHLNQVEIERGNTENRLNNIKEDSDVNINSGQIESNQSSSVAQVKLPNQIREIHELQRKNIKGITLQKQKFFINKEKIVFLRENPSLKTSPESNIKNINQQIQSIRERELEYWDYDSKNGLKTEKKVIPVTKITKIVENELKNTLLLVHSNEKQIVFVGDRQQLKTVKNWIELIQKILRQIPKTQEVNPNVPSAQNLNSM